MTNWESPSLQTISFTPGVSYDPDGFTLYGLNGRSAQVTHDTLCQYCGTRLAQIKRWAMVRFTAAGEEFFHRGCEE